MKKQRELGGKKGIKCSMRDWLPALSPWSCHLRPRQPGVGGRRKRRRRRLGATSHTPPFLVETAPGNELP